MHQKFQGLEQHHNNKFVGNLLRINWNIQDTLTLPFTYKRYQISQVLKYFE
mgnify:CR=1 FL=1